MNGIFETVYTIHRIGSDLIIIAQGQETMFISFNVNCIHVLSSTINK